MTNKYYWHFCNTDENGRGWLANDLQNTEAVPGLTLEMDGPIELCKRGYHASRRAIDALKYAPGEFCCLVELSGEIIEDDNKSVATKRTIIKCADVTRTLHEFAIWCAEQALALIDDPDPRSLEALVVKRRWLDGNASDDELAAARTAARDAAWAAARTAARDAAWAAARTAARDVARTAAWAAAWDAARTAARDVAWAEQNEKLEGMLLAALEG